MTAGFQGLFFRPHVSIKEEMNLKLEPKYLSY